MFAAARHVLLVGIAMPIVLFPAVHAAAQSATEPTAAALAEQIQALKNEYEARIGALESQLAILESETRDSGTRDAADEGRSPARASKPGSDNAFNPAVGVVLNGMVSEFSADEFAIPGFMVGHESERAPEGLALGHSELTMLSNIDDKFFGNLTLGLGAHPGEPTEVELEEAYIQTLPRCRSARRHAHQGGSRSVDVRLSERTPRPRRRLCRPSAPLPRVSGQRL